MYDLSPYLYIHTGLIIRLLRHSTGFTVDDIVCESDRLSQNIKNAGFSVSSEGLFRLKQFTEDLKKEQNQQRLISAAEIKTLSNLMNVIEPMVFAEAQTKKIYVLTEGRFNMESLVNKPWLMFANDIFYRLPQLSSYDIAEGFKCIVFSRATAAAFHLLRATEGTLREYYLQQVKRDRVKQLLWANMVQDLSRKKKKNQSLLNRLDYIRNTYRNPTAHPDARYDIEQVQDLVGLCIDVINGMGSELSLPKIDDPF
jgi:hypothetical protein